MSADPSTPDVWIDVLLDGQPVRTVRLGTRHSADAAGVPDGVTDPSATRRGVFVTLPTDGGLRLTIDLRRPVAGGGFVPAGPHVETFEHGVPPEGNSPAGSGRVTYGYDAHGRLTTVVCPDTGRRSPPTEPPDEPHVTG